MVLHKCLLKRNAHIDGYEEREKKCMGFLEMFTASHQFAPKMSSSAMFTSKARLLIERFKTLVKERRALVRSTSANFGIEQANGELEVLIESTVEETD